MKKFEAKVAAEALDIYQDELAPTYAAIREQQAGSFAVNSFIRDELAYEAESVTANTTLVYDFIYSLPHCYEDSEVDYALLASDAYTTRMIEANTMWPKERFNYRKRAGDYEHFTLLTPFYIIGERPSTEHKKQTEVLLFEPAGKTKDGFLVPRKNAFVVNVMTREKELAQELADARMFESYTKDEIQKLKTDGTMGARLGSPYQVTANSMVGNKAADKVSFIHRSDKALRARITRNGIWITPPRPLEGGLTDTAMAKFNVADRLNRLAVAFESTDFLHQLLMKQLENQPEHPHDKHI